MGGDSEAGVGDFRNVDQHCVLADTITCSFTSAAGSRSCAAGVLSFWLYAPAHSLDLSLWSVLPANVD